MKTLRLLFWLRWRIGINSTSAKSRWVTAGVTALFALAMAPLYVGGAAMAFAYARDAGAPALLVVFGCVQFVILWVSLLTGAMGRTFELDKLKRYPLRPLAVFSANTLASLSEPVVFMSLPSLVAAAAGVGMHSGPAAGVTAFGGAVLLLLVTTTLLQLLLALLDDLLRREWMRYVAAFFFTFSVIGFQFVVTSRTSRFVTEAKKAGLTTERLSAEAMRMFENIPSIAGPASVAGAHRPGPWQEPWAGWLACAVLVALPTWFGARVMAAGATRGSGGGPVRSQSVAASRGGFGLRLPGLDAAQGLLAGRELLYLLRTPALLYQMAVIPLTAIGLSFMRSSRDPQFATLMPMFLLVSSLAGRNLMMWGYDGPGMRTLFLLPLPARDLVLSKNVVWMASALLEATVVFTWMTLREPATVLPQLPMLATGYLAALLAGAVLGTWVSISKPVRPPQQGMGRRSPGGLIGLGAVLVLLLLAAAIIVSVMAVRALIPDPYDLVASTVVTSVFLVVAAMLWLISLDRNADLLETHREVMIDALTKSSDA